MINVLLNPHSFAALTSEPEVPEPAEIPEPKAPELELRPELKFGLLAGSDTTESSAGGNF